MIPENDHGQNISQSISTKYHKIQCYEAEHFMYTVKTVSGVKIPSPLSERVL